MATEAIDNDTESGLGGVADDLEAMGVETQAEPTPETEPDAEPSAPPTKPALDEDSIGRIVGGVLEKLPQAQPPQQEPKQYTQDELDTLFNVFKPSEELVQDILNGGEPALKAIVTMRDGLLKQFNTLTEYRVRTAVEELKKELGPGLEAASAARASREEENFYKANADLVNHKKVVGMVINDLRARGTQFKSAEEASKAIADGTRAFLKEMGVATGTSQGGGQQPKPMATLAGAPTGGAGNRQPPATGVSGDLKTLFG